MLLQRWVVQTGDGLHEFGYEGATPAGEAKVRIDGTSGTYPLILTIESRYRAILPLADHACQLETDTGGENVRLLVDGQPQPEAPLPGPDTASSTGTASASSATASPGPALSEADLKRWQRREKSGMGSFLTLIVLSALNGGLVLLNSSINFPFSIFATVLAITGGSIYAEEENKPLYLVIGLIVGIVILGIYLALYFLSRRHTWPVWTAFGLLVLDAGLVLLLGLVNSDLGAVVVDLLFHGWMIYSILMLGLARRRLKPRAVPDPVPTQPGTEVS